MPSSCQYGYTSHRRIQDLSAQRSLAVTTATALVAWAIFGIITIFCIDYASDSGLGARDIAVIGILLTAVFGIYLGWSPGDSPKEARRLASLCCWLGGNGGIGDRSIGLGRRFGLSPARGTSIGLPSDISDIDGSTLDITGPVSPERQRNPLCFWVVDR